MTVSAQTTVSSSTGNGVTTVFPYAFKIIAAADLEVLVDGVIKTLTTHYTVSGAGDDAGGNVTFLTAPANGATVVRRRNMQFLRAADYQYQGDLPNDVLNPDLDAPVLMAQQLKEQVDRSLRGPAGEAWSELPAAADRLDLFPVFDATTGALELSTVTQTQVASAVAAAYAAGSTADAVTFLQAGTGAVSRSVQDKMREHVSVKDFGAVGDGATNDKAAIVLAIAASKQIFFPAGIYYLGTTSGGEHLLPIDGSGGRVSIKTDGVVKFLTQTTASGSSGSIFRIANANGVVIDHIEGEDTGHDFTTTTGVVLLNIASTSGYPVTNVSIGSLKGYHVNAALRTSGLFADRVSNINIGAIYCNECYYGVNLQYQGDNVNIGALYFNAGQRSLFGYGARDVRAKIYSTNARAGSADLLINAESNQLVETEDWEVEYTCRTPVNTSALVQMKAHGETSKVINNIRIHFDVVSTTAANVFEVRAYDSGSVENTSTTNNVFSNIKFTGYISSTSSTWFNIYCQPSTKGLLDIDDSLILTSAGASNTGKISANFRTYFKLWGGGAFTPALVGTSTAGAASGGSETGNYYVDKGRVHFTIALSWTGHTGTGNFQINGLPITSRSGAQAVQPCAVVYNNLAVGSGKEVGAAVLANTQYVTLYAMDQAGGAVALIPVEAAGSLYVSGSYEI